MSMQNQEAISKIITQLKTDKSYRKGWIANIAMAYIDNEHWYKQKTGKRTLNKNDKHTIANNAAEYFLKLLCATNKNEKKNKYADPINDSIFIYKFSPDSELINLAEWFSKNYKKISCGKYYSDNKKYTIKYVFRLKNVNNELSSTCARIENGTRNIELDKSLLKNNKYTSDFIFFIILWCIVVSEQNNKGDIQMADKLTLDYYLTTNRSKKNLLNGYIQMISKTPSALNKLRFENIKKST